MARIEVVGRISSINKKPLAAPEIEGHMFAGWAYEEAQHLILTSLEERWLGIAVGMMLWKARCLTIPQCKNNQRGRRKLICSYGTHRIIDHARVIHCGKPQCQVHFLHFSNSTGLFKRAGQLLKS